ATYEALYGRIVSAWNLTHEEVTVEVEVPVNTTATILLPTASIEDVKENGIKLLLSEGISDVTQTDEGVLFVAGSGIYQFVYPNARGLKTVYTPETIVLDLLENEEATKVLEKYEPRVILKSSSISHLRTKPLRQIVEDQMTKLTEEGLNALLEELNALENEL